MAPSKSRLDLLLVDKGLVASRQRARALIMAGNVMVDNQRVDKPGISVSTSAQIILRGNDPAYVSRGGLKLKKALDHFQIDINGLVCMDVGASTGGFTDCLLQHGAQKVFAVDVGYGQLAWKLRQDARVIPVERTNIRHLAVETIGVPIDLITVDTSFISLKIVLPAVLKFLKPARADLICLIKPQFEVGKGKVGKGGVVRDPDLHTEVLAHLNAFFPSIGLTRVALTTSPILGPKGNKEFIVHLQRAPHAISRS